MEKSQGGVVQKGGAELLPAVEHVDAYLALISYIFKITGDNTLATRIEAVDALYNLVHGTLLGDQLRTEPLSLDRNRCIRCCTDPDTGKVDYRCVARCIRTGDCPHPG